MSKAKRKRIVLSVQAKIDIVNRLARGERAKRLAQIYNVGKATISSIKRNKQTILNYVSQLNSEEGSTQRKTMRSAQDETLEKAVFLWFLQKRNLGEPITGPLLCKKALDFNKKLNGSTMFKASSGWLKRFKTRHGIKLLNIKGSTLSGNIPSSFENESCEPDQKILSEEDILKSVRNQPEYLEMIQKKEWSSDYTSNSDEVGIDCGSQDSTLEGINEDVLASVQNPPADFKVRFSDMIEQKDHLWDCIDNADETGVNCDLHDAGFIMLNDKDALTVTQNSPRSLDGGNAVPTRPTHTEAFLALETVMRWFEVQDESNPTDLLLLKRLKDIAAKKQLLSQTKCLNLRECPLIKKEYGSDEE